MDVAGKWHLIMESLIGKQGIDLDLTTDGTKLGGITATSDGLQTCTIYEGVIKGDELIWKIDVEVPMHMTLTFNATVNGDSMFGKAKAGSFGSYAVNGNRV